MSFYVFAEKPFDNDHEKAKSKLILDLLKPLYQDNPEYCYCLLDIPYHDSSGDRIGQYDIIVLMRNSISTIEMKSMNGRLVGNITKNYGNDDLAIHYQGGGQGIIRVSQVESQHKHLIDRLVNDFKSSMYKDADKYQIDSYLLFRDPLDTTLFEITNPQIAKWLKIVTEQTFITAWKNAKHSSQFSLAENEIHFIAEDCFKLNEVEPSDYSINFTSIRDRINRLLGIEADYLYKSFNYEMIRKTVLERLTEEEFIELLTLRRSISSLDPQKQQRFKMLFNKLTVPYLSYQRIDNFFLSEILVQIRNILDHATDTFISIPKAVHDMNLDNPIVPKLTGVNIGVEAETMIESVKAIENLLYDFSSFVEIKIDKWGRLPECKKDVDRGVLLLNICLRMEPFHE